MHQDPDNGFNRVASFYDPLARLVFRTAQLEAQHVLLPFIQDKSSVLIIGGGSGWLLEQVLQKRKNLQILYLDASAKMVQLAQKRTRHLLETSSCQVEFRTGTEQAILPAETFDIIFAPFLLDLFPAQRLTALMTRLHAALAENGLWLFADFWPVKQPAPFWQKLLLKAMYLFFGVLSNIKATRLPDFKQHFQLLHLHENFSKSFYRGMIQAKVFSRKASLFVWVQHNLYL